VQSDPADTSSEPRYAVRRFHFVTTRLSASDVIELADRAGVARRVGSLARKGRPIGTEAYLKLSNALGLDPCTGLPSSAAATPQARCHWSLLAATLFFERSRRRLGIRAAACEIGVSTATLSRAENGNAIAIESALRVSAWLRLSPNVLLGFRSNNEAVTAPVTRETSPDDLVAAASSCWSRPCP
jgi:plasmid maintenance system antidote protein VapI